MLSLVFSLSFLELPSPLFSLFPLTRSEEMNKAAFLHRFFFFRRRRIFSFLISTSTSTSWRVVTVTSASSSSKLRTVVYSSSSASFSEEVLLAAKETFLSIAISLSLSLSLSAALSLCRAATLWARCLIVFSPLSLFSLVQGQLRVTSHTIFPRQLRKNGGYNYKRKDFFFSFFEGRHFHMDISNSSFAIAWVIVTSHTLNNHKRSFPLSKRKLFGEP